MALKQSSKKHWSFETSAEGYVPSACLLNHTLWMINGSNINGYDILKGQASGPTFTPHHGGPRQLATWGNSLVAATADGTIFKLNTEAGTNLPLFETGYVEWMQAYAGNLYVSSQAGIQYISPGQTTPSSHVFPFSPRCVPCFGNQLLLVAFRAKHSHQNQITALDPETLQQVWTLDIPALPVTDLISDEGAVYFATSANTVVAIDLHTKSIRWQQDMGTPITANPCFDQGTVFIPTHQQVTGLDKNNGKTKHQFPINDTASRVTMQIEGVIYLAGATSVIGIDVETGNTLEEALNRSLLIGVSDAVAICIGDHEVLGVSFKETLREFYVESHLMQDFDFDAQDGEDKVATYQTELMLYDELGGPRLNHKLHIWATEPTTISLGGRPWQVDGQNYAEAVTDNTGRLRITSQAEGFSTPGLLIWASFMDEDEKILVTPAYQIHDQLSGLTGDQLAEAVDFKGQPILNNDYRNNPRAQDAVAQTIAQTTGLAKRANINRNATDKYAAQGCDEGATCCVTQDQHQVTMTCDQPYLLDLSSSQQSFTQLTQTQVEAYVQANPVTNPPNLASLQQRGLHLNLWRAIEEDHLDIRKLMVHTLEDAAQSVQAVVSYVWQGVEYVASAIVSTLEEAMLLVEALFKKICTSLKSAVQAFSFLFSWERIKELTVKIGTQIETSWQNFFEGGQLDALQTALEGRIANFKANIDSYYDSLHDLYGNQSSLKLQKNATAAKKDPASGGTRHNWMTDKLTQNTLPTQAAETNHLQSRSINLSIPTIPIGPNTVAVFENFFNQLKNSISDDVMATFSAILTDLKSGSATTLLAQAATVIIDIFKGVTDLGLDLVTDFMDLLFDLFRALYQDGVFDAVLNMQLQIPFVSDLFQKVVGLPLTMKNLWSLLAAIPMSIAEKATGHQFFADSVAITLSDTLNFLANSLQVIWGMVSGLMGAIPTKSELVTGLEATREPEEPKGYTPSQIANFKTGTCVSALIVIRGLYIGAIWEDDSLSLNAKKEKTIIWLGPTLSIALSSLFAYYYDCRPMWKVIGAISLACFGVLSAGTIIHAYLNDDQELTSNYYIFAVLVTTSLFLNSTIILTGSYEMVRAAISGASGALISVSGFVGLNLIPGSDKNNDGQYAIGMTL